MSDYALDAYADSAYDGPDYADDCDHDTREFVVSGGTTFGQCVHCGAGLPVAPVKCTCDNGMVWAHRFNRPPVLVPCIWCAGTGMTHEFL